MDGWLGDWFRQGVAEPSETLLPKGNWHCSNPLPFPTDPACCFGPRFLKQPESRALHYVLRKGTAPIVGPDSAELGEGVNRILWPISGRLQGRRRLISGAAIFQSPRPAPVLPRPMRGNHASGGEPLRLLHRACGALARRLSLYCASPVRLLHVSGASLLRLFRTSRGVLPVLSSSMLCSN
jgi:hypothetical protein